MATVDKNFKIKNGLIVGDSTNLVNYSSAAPSNPFIGQLWVDVDEDFPAENPDLYLTSACAALLYTPISASNNYLFSSTASSIYLRQDAASTIYAPIISASLVGTPTAPTASVGSNNNQIATTAFVYSMLTGIDGGVPSSTYEFSIDGGTV